MPCLGAPHSALNEATSALTETTHMQRNPAIFRSTCEYAIQMAANELLHLKGVSEAPVTVTTAMATATKSLRDTAGAASWCDFERFDCTKGAD